MKEREMYYFILRVLSKIFPPTIPLVYRLCGEWKIEEFPIIPARRPLLCDDEYDRNTSIMTIDLVRRWSYAIYTSSEMKLPDHWSTICEIRYNPDQPPLICVVRSNHNIPFVIVRGTLTMQDVVTGGWSVPAPGHPPGPAYVHAGYKHVAELCLRQLVDALPDESGDIIFAGHSMGAVVGIILAQYLYVRGFSPIVYAYGIPRFSKDGTYPFPIHTILCSEDQVALGKLFPEFKHIGNIIITEGITEASHSVDSYYSSIYFDCQRTHDNIDEDINQYTTISQ